MPFRSPSPASVKSLFVSDLGTLKNLVEGMPVAIGIAALDRRTAGPMVVPESRIVYYNRKWRETFGFGMEDCATAGEATLRLYPDAEQRAENYRRREEAVRKALATGKPAEPLQMRARVADGSTRTFLTGTTVLEGMMVVSMEDATALEAGMQEGGGGFPGKERVAVARAGAPELMVALDAVAAVEADGKYTRVLSGSCWTPDGRNIGTWQRMVPEL